MQHRCGSATARCTNTARLRGAVAVALALACIGLAERALAREVQLQGFGFEIPADWTTEGGGPARSTFFATGARTRVPYAPPWLTAEACAASKPGDCAAFDADTLARELAGKGCTAAQRPPAALPAPRIAGLETVRWTCQAVTKADGPVSLAVSAVRADGAHLLLMHVSGRGADADLEFLDALVRTMSVRAAAGPPGR